MRKDAIAVIYDILTIRSKVNKKLGGGKKYIPLSKTAKQFMLTKNLSKSFWRKFETRHNLRRKRQGSASLHRAVACTRKMAKDHLDESVQECIDCGIFTNYKKVAPGIWTGALDCSRIFNHDEMPQFINYGVNGQANGLVFCGKGDKCEKLRKENRQCVTIEPFVSVSGSMEVCHVIFPATCITNQMAPKEAVEKINNLLISTTASGYQDHSTCLASYKTFNNTITQSEVVKPVVCLTDGHGSRFDPKVMRFCRENEIYQFLEPPMTTGSTQLLDQIFASLHAT